MKDLRREQAPISPEAWAEIDAEAARVIKLNVAGRKLVEFDGPLGWQASSVNLGRIQPLAPAPGKGVSAVVRCVQPLVELRADFSLARRELEDIGRGAKSADLDALVEAATAIAHAEDRTLFAGYEAGGITGISEASPHAQQSIASDYTHYPATVTEAIETLRQSGVDGPYAIALGPRCYAGLMKATDPGGYPVFERVRRMVDQVVRAPAVDGAVVIGRGGADFELTVGQDLSIGYASHSDDEVRLYLIESLTFRVLAPEAAVALVYGQAKGSKRK